MIYVSKTKHLVAIGGAVALLIAVISWAVQPGVPDFSKYEAGAERKEVFFSYFLPLIDQHNAAILKTRQQVVAWHQARETISWWDSFRIESLAEDYRIEDFDIDSDEDWATLLRRIDAIPPSLALAQAAKESGWGTSRFSLEAYNYYGQWCYQQGCGLVPASRDTGKIHEIATFESPDESIESYIHNLNSHDAYRPLREVRASLRAADKPITGAELANGLDKYSQQGSQYIKELRSMIVRNDLLQHDLSQPDLSQPDLE